ncbi:thiamine-phosphate pyrophosphorylase [Desulfatibacillum aliphaticivorans]|uniref:Thiamine-phosphate synthase n=1 Tax=Desulfatibacillum aliphaticivorans TaxID=218208 RepID=B8FB00_DESAL|nr:thiamine phosphate synthase [Desulfatibacillum aliphaticivorans]ACL04086.1 thiamine-phosphate pyrophosphorylase [Desulfatibacillum aliphaticivorans]
MDKPYGLYLILTNPVAGYEACAWAAVNQGLRYLQLRMKHAPREEILEKALSLREITKGSKTLFIVNDHVDIAKEADADGVHLGQEDMSLEEARSMWTAPGKQFGLSTHGVEQELAARDLQPDYIGVGPVFPTPTKDKPDPTVGLEAMGRIIKGSPLSCVAIGGINPENLPQVLEHGAGNFSVVRAVNQSHDPESAIANLMDVWRKHYP